jgi:hypothetical protein
MNSAGTRDEIVARLESSRGELRALLEPSATGAPYGQRAGRGFPRSRTMRLLTSSHGAGTVAALGAGLFLSRPAMALRLLKIIPLGAAFRMLLLRLFTASGAKS